MSIRTIGISGQHTPGTTFVTLYTVPTGYHLRLREATFETNAGDTITVNTRASAGTPDVRLFTDPTFVANVPITWQGWRVLEAGDLVLASAIAGGTTFKWLLSGTLYSN